MLTKEERMAPLRREDLLTDIKYFPQIGISLLSEVIRDSNISTVGEFYDLGIEGIREFLVTHKMKKFRDPLVIYTELHQRITNHKITDNATSHILS